MEKFGYLGEAKAATGIAADSVLSNVSNERSQFRDLLRLLISRGLLVGPKNRLYSVCVHNTMLSRSETGTFKEDYKHILERKYPRMVKRMCNFRRGDRISAVDLAKKLQVFTELKIIMVWSYREDKCRKLAVVGGLVEINPRKR